MLIGLMIKDEADILAEALENYSRFCDAILVFDGVVREVQRRSKETCNSFEKVAEYWQNEVTGYPLPRRGGARKLLLEKSRESGVDVTGMRYCMVMKYGRQTRGHIRRTSFFFFDSGYRNYRATKHSSVLPARISNEQTGIVIEQYNYRSP